MKKWINNNKLYIFGAMVGAVGGYLYWQQIGCASGICMITSKPLNSTIYGAAMGGLFFGMFKKRSNKNENKSTL
jgi:hypothetical protein